MGVTQLEELLNKLKNLLDQTYGFLEEDLRTEADEVIGIGNIIIRLRELDNKIEEVKRGNMSTTSLCREIKDLYEDYCHYYNSSEKVGRMIEKCYRSEDVHNLLMNVIDFKEEMMGLVPLEDIIHPKMKRVYEQILELSKKEEKPAEVRVEKAEIIEEHTIMIRRDISALEENYENFKRVFKPYGTVGLLIDNLEETRRDAELLGEEQISQLAAGLITMLREYNLHTTLWQIQQISERPIRKLEEYESIFARRLKRIKGHYP